MAVNEELIGSDEALRLAAVRRYDVLDTPPDGAFERITKLAARQFGVPISIVSIVDTDRIWFKSHHGLDVEQVGRDPGLCASAILGDDPWIVENAETDPRTMANPLVAGELGLRFYAGAPLTTHDGHHLGTLCVIDAEPRQFGERDAELLTELAAVVMDELELRLDAKRAVRRELALREDAEQMARALQQSLLPAQLPAIAGADVAALYQPADASVVGGDFYDVFETDDAVALVVGDVSGKGSAAAAVTALARHTIRTAALSGATAGEILAALNRAMLLGRESSAVDQFCTVLLMLARPAGDGFSLSVSGAGHPPAIVLERDGATTELGAPGPPAGWYPEATYHETSTELRSGDAVVLFTDGLTEARTEPGMLGIEGVGARLRPGGATRSAADISRVLADTIADEDVDVRDDVAALVFRAA